MVSTISLNSFDSIANTITEFQFNPDLKHSPSGVAVGRILSNMNSVGRMMARNYITSKTWYKRNTNAIQILFYSKH